MNERKGFSATNPKNVDAFARLDNFIPLDSPREFTGHDKKQNLSLAETKNDAEGILGYLESK